MGKFKHSTIFHSLLCRNPAQPASVVSAWDEHDRTDPDRSLRHATTATPWYGGNADARHDEHSKAWHGPPTANAPWIWGILADTIALLWHSWFGRETIIIVNLLSFM